MVRLKSFKYLDASAESSPRGAEQNTEVDGDASPLAARSNSLSSSAASGSTLMGESTISGVGGALTSASSSEAGGAGANRSTSTARAPTDDSQTLSSHEEYQSAHVELGEEEEEEVEVEVEVGTGNVDGAKEARRTGSVDEKRHLAETAAMHARVSSDCAEVGLDRQKSKQQAAARTPLQARLKLQMPRSATSPSPLALACGQHTQQQLMSPKLFRARSGTQLMGSVSPLVAKTTARAAMRTSDSLSQSSVAMSPGVKLRSQQWSQSNGMAMTPATAMNGGQTGAAISANHFEIRWHNVRLFARPKSRLPRLITDTHLYRTLFNAAPLDEAALLYDESQQLAGCYSPPMLHKIPPTIEEVSEMRTPHGSEAGSERASKQQSLSLGFKVADARQQQAQQPGARCILNSISGQVFSGQMTAILGPSGVGKTTLLNSLTGRNTLDGSGRVQLLGAQESKRMSVVTVPQVDVLPGKLTTLEDLRFTSRLKNPERRFDHARNIERIVKHLHMDKFLHTRIDKLSGGEARRLSIARELLASPDIMILDEPTSGLDANTCKKIITALRDIVEHSDHILDKPMSIIITIHQPQQEVYNLFHRVYVMAQGGRAIYEGAPEQLLATLLEHSSLARVCPTEQLNENPAIVAIELASGEFGSQPIQELAAHHENQVLEEFFLYSPLPPAVSPNLDSSPVCTPRSLRPHKSPALSSSRHDMSLHRIRLNSFDSSIGRPTPILAKRQLAGMGAPGSAQWDRMSSITSLSYASTYDAELPEISSRLKVDKRLRRSVVMKSHFWSHTLTLIERCWLLTKRDMFLMAIRILGFLLVAAGTVQIFSHALDPQQHQCPQFESEVDDMYTYMGLLRGRLTSLLDMLRQGNSTHLFFFHVLLCITMVTSALTGLVFPLQMRMFMREYKNGWYSPASFITSQTIAELPADIIGPLVTLLITYPLCHQPESVYHWREISYAVTLIITCIICKSQAQIVGAFLMDSVENSVFISCVCVTAPALLSGIPIRIQQLIAPVQWVSYASFLRYAFESLLSLRYGYGMCPCDPERVNGYPIVASSAAIPPHLENLAAGLLELNQPTLASNLTTVAPVQGGDLSASSTELTTLANMSIGRDNENLFLRFIRLITDASNFFVGGQEIASCQRYRSLYLIGMDIPNDIFTRWLGIMLFMFIVSRFITYFVVKTVIKLRRS